MDENKNAKIMKVTHTPSRHIDNCIYSRSKNNSSTVVYGGDISNFHFFEALLMISLKQDIFTAHFYTPSNILVACRTMQVRFVKLNTMLANVFNWT